MRAHLLIYSILFFELSLGFGLDFEFELGLILGLKLELEFWVRFRGGIRAGIGFFLFLHNVTAASASSLVNCRVLNYQLCSPISNWW